MTTVPGEGRTDGAGRRSRLLTQLSADDSTHVNTALLCQVCADVTGMTGAGIMLLCGDCSQSAGASDHGSSRIEELQFTLGEGPALDAYEQDRPVLESDLADSATGRWFGFTPPAVQEGVSAVFAFPLHVGVARLGTLTFYSDRPGALSDEQHADALAMAEVVTDAVLLMQAKAPADALAPELAAQANQRSAVHQAAGMMSAQLDVSVAQALIRLRAYCFSNDQRIGDVANDVVHRRLRFDPGQDATSPG